MEAAINEAFEQVHEDEDAWIDEAFRQVEDGGQAMAYDMTLITRDAHFSRIAPYGLVYQFWR